MSVGVAGRRWNLWVLVRRVGVVGGGIFGVWVLMAGRLDLEWIGMIWFSLA